jgi:hypothetical protein
MSVRTASLPTLEHRAHGGQIILIRAELDEIDAGGCRRRLHRTVAADDPTFPAFGSDHR